MNTETFVSPLVALAILIVAIAGCATPPQPQSTPPPPPSQSPPPPQQSKPPSENESSAGAAAAQEQSDSATPAQPSETAAAAKQESPAAEKDLEQPNGPPPSNESADVEITDIPVDENGNPIIDKKRPEATQDSGTEQRNASTSTPGQRPSGSGGPTTTGAPAGAGSAATAPGGAQTEAERLAALEQDLDGRLAKFDELMRKAREDAEKERAAGGYSSYGSPNGGQGSRQTPPPNGNGAGGQADTSSGLGHTPDETGSTRPGAYQSAENSADGVIPNGRDDDIVARQLREAASRETDPVLREKLWDEYRKYKKGISR